MDMKEYMRAKKWGIFNHYICTPGRDEHFGGADLSDWNRTVDSFDVDRLAYTLHELGAGYYFITLIHGSEYIIAPNETYERYMQVGNGELCPRRDLVEDLYKALSKYDIDLCLYFNCLSPFNDCFGEKLRNTLGIKGELKGQRDVLTINDGETFIANWTAFLHEYAERYGDKIKMWWLDSCYERSGYTPERIKLYHDAIKSANPDALIAYNKDLVPPGGKLVKYMDFEDFTCGEKIGFDLIPESGDVDGSLAHLLIPLGIRNPAFFGPWCASGTVYTNEEIKDYVHKVNAVGGIVTFDIRVLPDGSFDPTQVEALKGI